MNHIISTPDDARVYEEDTVRIETSRLILRPFTESDAAAVAHNSTQYSVAHSMPEMVKETSEVALRWIRYVNMELFDSTKPCVLLAITRKTDKQCMGCIFVQWKAEWGNELEMGYYIADEYQNNGYATEAGKAMIWWVFEKAQQEVISAFVRPENKASYRVIEKLGFVYGGTQILPHNGEDCEFDYFRFYNTDTLPGPEWDIHTFYKAEPMGDFFDVRADIYNDKMLSNDGIEDYKKLGAHFPKTDEPIKILDIGCGTGIELEYIWAQAPNAHITCVDISRGMLDLLMSAYPGNHDRITVVETSYIDRTYPENSYDIVVSNMTMHHLWQDEKTAVYRKILNAIRPGGSYIEGDFTMDAIAVEQYRRRYEIITANLPGKAKPGEYHIDIPFTVETQVKLLQDAGFKSVEIMDTSINHGKGVILEARK